MAARSVKAKRYDDLKVMFYGPSEEYLAQLSGTALEHFNILMENKAVDSACVAIAKNSGGVDKKLEEMGVSLMPAGERLAYYVNNGYSVVTF